MGAESEENIKPYNPEGTKDWEEGEWCALCHGHCIGGEDLLYCCDHCPRIYHPTCYVPTLVDEPDDGWKCMLCFSRQDIEKYSTAVNGGSVKSGNLGVRDLKVCERIMFEIFSSYPESITFHYLQNLDFPAYTKMIKDPIALDLIKERLDPTKINSQYCSVLEFVSDMRRMFKNCRTFWTGTAGGNIYVKHADNLEAFFDSKLKEWATLLSVDPFLKPKPIESNKTSDINQLIKNLSNPLSNKRSSIEEVVDVPEEVKPPPAKKPKPKRKTFGVKTESYVPVKSNRSSKTIEFDGLSNKIKKPSSQTVKASGNEGGFGLGLAFRSFKRKPSSEEEINPEIDDDSNLSMPSEERQCKFCEAVYSKSDQIRNHTLKHFESEISALLPNAAKKPFKCPKCNEEYKEMSLLIRHYGFQHHCTEDDLNGKLYVPPIDEPAPKETEKESLQKVIEQINKQDEYRDVADVEDLFSSDDEDHANETKNKGKGPKRSGRPKSDEDEKMMKSLMSREERAEHTKLLKQQKEKQKEEERKKREEEKKKKELEKKAKKEEELKTKELKKKQLEEQKIKERKLVEEQKIKMEEQKLKEKQERMLKEEEERIQREKEQNEEDQWASLPLEGDPSDDELPVKITAKEKSVESDTDEFSGLGDLPLF